MEDDLDAAVRQLARALRARDPGDPAVKLLRAAVDAAGQLRQLTDDEARRRVDAAVRVLGVLAPDPDTKSHVRPGASSSSPGPAATGDEQPVAPPGQAASRGGRRPAPASGAAAPGTGARTRPASAAHRAPGTGSRGGLRSHAEAGAGAERTPVVAAGRPDPATRGLRRTPLGQPPAPGVSAALSELARAWAELGRGALPSEPIELLAELVRTGVPDGAEAVRFHLALLRGVDLALGAARFLPCEQALLARAAPLLRAAIEGARALGVQVHPGLSPAPCPVQALPAFGAPQGEVVWVDQHGFALADGRTEPAIVRVAVAPPPPWFEALLEGYAVVVDAAAASPSAEGAGQARAYRRWLDELPRSESTRSEAPGEAHDEERRCTTLRYAATAVFDVVQSDASGPGGGAVARAAFARLAQELEQAGSYVIPLDAEALSDARRYELVLRPGVGAPRLVRPGFQGPDHVVQQRARVLADPGWLGTMEASRR